METETGASTEMCQRPNQAELDLLEQKRQVEFFRQLLFVACR